jgi:hypothetical protein
VTSADSDDHSPDPDCHGIAAERALVERFDRHAFVEAEVAKASGASGIERIPVDSLDAGANADLQGLKGRLRHIAIDYQ